MMILTGHSVLPYSAGSADRSVGFTLIELLVTVAIGLLLITLGVAGFLDFNERQKLTNAAQELETVFQTAQIKAQGGDLGGCNELTEYQVSFDLAASPVTATLTPVCATTDANTGTAKVYELGAGITLSLTPASTSVVHFRVLQRGIIFTPATDDVVFTLSSTAISKKYSFTLSQGGDINDGIWE